MWRSRLSLAGLVVAAALSLGWLIRLEIGSHASVFTVDRGPGADGLEVAADLVLIELDPAAGVLTGSVAIEIDSAPTESRGGVSVGPALGLSPIATLPTRQRVVFSHHAPDAEDPATARSESRGHSEPIALAPGLAAELMGSARVAVEVVEERGLLLYPFDRYRLDLNLELVEEQENRLLVLRTTPIDRLRVQVSAPGLAVAVRGEPWRSAEGRARAHHDSATVRLQRPLTFRVVAAVAGAASLLFLLFLGVRASPEAYVGKLVAFFAGLWGLREAFGADRVFPSLADYLTTAVSVLAVLIVTIRWLQDAGEAPMRPCPHCLSDIPPLATRCRHCAIALQGRAEADAASAPDAPRRTP